MSSRPTEKQGLRDIFQEQAARVGREFRLDPALIAKTYADKPERLHAHDKALARYNNLGGFSSLGALISGVFAVHGGAQAVAALSLAMAPYVSLPVLVVCGFSMYASNKKLQALKKDITSDIGKIPPPAPAP